MFASSLSTEIRFPRKSNNLLLIFLLVWSNENLNYSERQDKRYIHLTSLMAKMEMKPNSTATVTEHKNDQEWSEVEIFTKYLLNI